MKTTDRPQFDRSAVAEYLRLHAQAAIAEKRMKALRQTFLPLLREGVPSPDDLPLLLVLRSRTQLDRDYKTHLLEALREALLREYPLTAPERAVTRLADIEASFPTKDIEALCVEENKAWTLRELQGA